MKNKRKRYSVLVILLIFVAVFIGFKVLNNSWGIGLSPKNISEEKVDPSATPSQISCTRTTRLENDPQYDRALSLIQQRVSENSKWWDKYGEDKDLRFKHFPSELINCIKISEDSSKNTSGIEGYFTFNDEEIKADYYPITVSDGYRYADDITTALLLSHEITHVQQYINERNNKGALSCIDMEINAFIAQQDFYTILNTEEIDSGYHRIQNDKSLHPQLQMMNTMQTINRESGCAFEGGCLDLNLRSSLRKILTEDSVYRKQCELQ